MFGSTAIEGSCWIDAPEVIATFGAIASAAESTPSPWLASSVGVVVRQRVGRVDEEPDRRCRSAPNPAGGAAGRATTVTEPLVVACAPRPLTVKLWRIGALLVIVPSDESTTLTSNPGASPSPWFDSV